MDSLVRRFLRYVKVHTTSDPESDSTPSTRRQFDLLRMLEEELSEMGAEDVHLSPEGAVYASLPGEGPDIGLIAHVDTSPDAPGKDVSPVLHRDWDGSPIRLAEDQVIDPAECSDMSRYRGGTIITSDGTTLLGADDKAGVAIIMEVLKRLVRDSDIPRPGIRVAFTTDEEVGRGVDGFDTDRFGARFAYTVDGSSVGRVDHQTFSAWKASWKIHGREVHPGYAKGAMVSALRMASQLVGMVGADRMPEASAGMDGYIYPHSLSASVGLAELEMLIRDFTAEGGEAKLKQLRAMRAYLETAFPGSRVDLDIQEQYRNPAEVLREDGRPVDYAMEGTRRAGLEPLLASIRGGTDGSRLSYMGVPTVNLPTGGELFHSRREWVAAEGMELAMKTVLGTLAVWGEESRKG
jgi:tripeptide aminopeptidase